MWQRSAPSNLTALTHQHLLDTGSPSDLPELQEEETLEFQEEYPWEEVEEVEEAEEEDSPLPCQRHKQPRMRETSLLVTHHSLSQEIADNPKHS